MTHLSSVLLVLALSGPSGGETVLLDFTADWCGYCREMDPIVRQLADAGYPVRKVDFDRERELAARFGVTRIPCFVMLVDGQVVAKELGPQSLGKLEQLCRLGANQTAPAPRTTGQQAPAVFTGSPTAQTDVRPASHNRAAPARQTAPDADLLAATVRLRVEDPTGHSCGTGTIIDARHGKSLILTCGHLFRASQGKGSIEVELFGANRGRSVPGELIAYDEKRDLALLFIRPPGPVVAARVAATDYVAAAGDSVINIGCNNGHDPTARHNRVTSVNRYLGPANLQVGGLPVEGRSGGGLFSLDGRVIGVCNAADPYDDEGFYAAAGAIQAMLDEARVSFVYRQDGGVPGVETSLAATATSPMQSMQSMQPMRAAPSMAAEMPTPTRMLQATGSPMSSFNTVTPQLSDGREQAALEEILRRKAQGDEVIVIVRPRGNPQAPSDILVLDDVSPDFLRRLATGPGRGATQSGPPRQPSHGAGGSRPR